MGPWGRGVRLPSKQVQTRAALILLLLLLTLVGGGNPSRAEYAFLDFRFAVNRALGAAEEPADVAVLLVTLDSEASVGDVYGADWRRYYPEMLARLASVNARAVVWDATFVAEMPELDGDLAAAFTRLPVVAAEGSEERSNPILRPDLAAIGWKQFVVVQGLPRRTVAEAPLPPLGAAAARVAVNPGAGGEAQGGGDHLDGSESLWLDFSFDPTSVPTFDIADIIQGSDERLANENRTPLSVFADRVVFIGTDLPGGDRYPIPGSGGRRVPGVLAQVVSFWTHLSERRIARVDGWPARLIALVPAVGVVLFGTWRSRRGRRIGIIGLILLTAIVPPLVFAVWRLWLPHGLMLLEVVAAIGLVAVTHRMRLAQNYRASLGFDPTLLERHAAEIESTAEGIEREAAVICADVRNYTQFVTDHAPDKVQRIMTEYLAEMERVIHEHGGYVNKYIGDEIIAVFGFPLEEGRAAHRAVEAARDMLSRVGELNEGWQSAGLPGLDGIGVGVDAGDLRFTNVGGKRRIQFDIMGNPVNGASRLQSLTKEYGMPMVLSGEVAAAQGVFPGGGEGGPAAGRADAAGRTHAAGRADAAGRTHAAGAVAHLELIGPVAIRGQGERRLYGLRRSDGAEQFSIWGVYRG